MDISYIINELGEERGNYFNAVAPPIIQTSNYAYKNVEELEKLFADEMSGFIYSRGLNPTVDILRKKLAALDGAEDCLVFNNGTAAIYAAVMANIKAGDHIVSIKNPYSWVQKLFDVILPRFGVATTYIDGTLISNWENAIQKNTSFFYLESPNSWDFALQDIPAVAKLAKAKSIVTLIDNSYCTPLCQSPVAMGIDMAMQTATKYIGGHSDTLGGVLSGSHIMMKKIFDSEYLNIGSGIQPFNAWLLIRGLRTLPARLERITRSTFEVVKFMRQHPKIESLLFPFDSSFPQYDLAKRQMKEVGGLFTFTLKTSKRKDIVRFCESLQHILMAVSWGGHESLIMPKCAGILAAQFDASNNEHRYIRMYVGLEDAEYLIRDLEKGLDVL